MKTRFLSALLISVIGTPALAITDALKIKIVRGAYSDETIIRYEAGATKGFDASYDAWKLFSSNTAVPNIYTKDSAANQLSINALPAFTSSVIMDVYLKIGVAGNHTLTFTELGAFSPDVKITLKDVSCNQYYDLRSCGSLIFNLTVMTLASSPRFKILFSYPVSVQASNATCSSCNNGGVTITKPGENFWQYIVRDSLGSIAASGNAVSPTQYVFPLLPRTYTVTITNSYQAVETKIFSVKTNPVILPVELMTFEAAVSSGGVLSEWSTASEVNSDYFSVERSADGEIFQPIGVVHAAGHSSEEKKYNWLDEFPLSGISFYRLRQTDVNGSFTHSETVSVIFHKTFAVSVFPNPASEYLNIRLEGKGGTESHIIIRDLLGKEQHSEKIIQASDNETIIINLDSELAKGVYLISVLNSENLCEQKFIIK